MTEHGRHRLGPWADAVTALLRQGRFRLSRRRQQFGNLPTRFTSIPRCHRVVAVRRHGRRTALCHLPIRKMAGCYGPPTKDDLIAAYKPNVRGPSSIARHRRHGWRRIGRDPAVPRGGAVDAEEQGRPRTYARTGCGSKRPPGLFDSVKRPTPISRAESAAACAADARSIAARPRAKCWRGRRPPRSPFLAEVLTGSAWANCRPAASTVHVSNWNAVDQQQSHDIERFWRYDPSRSGSAANPDALSPQAQQIGEGFG